VVVEGALRAMIRCQARKYKPRAGEFPLDFYLNLRYILCMHVITRKRLIEFAKKYPKAESELDHWYRIVKRTNFDSFAELRKTFPSADHVGKFTVFDIGGNKARLIASIHYNKKIIYIRHVLSHKEYDNGTWKE
jgi:mRNA interferase HigB